MTHRLLSTLMSLFLALHTVLGCCWHHAHACTQECSNPRSLESVDVQAGRCADECNTAGCGDQQHHGRHECQGQTCVFLDSAGRSSHGPVAQSHVPTVSSVPCGQLAIHVAAVEPFFAANALLPPLRLHLAHQVLLL